MDHNQINLRPNYQCWNVKCRTESAGRWLICGWGAFSSPVSTWELQPAALPRLQVWVMLTMAGPEERGGWRAGHGEGVLSGARNHTCLHFLKLYHLCNLSSFISIYIKSKCEQLDKLCLVYCSLRKCERITLNFIPPIRYLGHNCLLCTFLKSFEIFFVYTYIHIFLYT